MSKQQSTQAKAIAALQSVERAIDELKSMGPCPHDDDNALLNLSERLLDLSKRATPPAGWAHRRAH